MAGVASGAVSAGTSGIGAFSVVAAACGGGIKGAGFEFPMLTTTSRILLAVVGIGLIVFEQFRSGNWRLNSEAYRRLSGRTALAFAALAFLVLVWLGLNRRVIADPAALPVRDDCPVRADSTSLRSPTTYWVLEGFKLRPDRDDLDSDRNVYDPCVRRSGETMTIYRQTQVWQGADPAKLIGPGKLSIQRTDFVLLPGTTVTVTGELSGPSVQNNRGETLYYNVWAPIALPSDFDTNVPGSH